MGIDELSIQEWLSKGFLPLTRDLSTEQERRNQLRTVIFASRFKWKKEERKIQVVIVRKKTTEGRFDRKVGSIGKHPP